MAGNYGQEASFRDENNLTSTPLGAEGVWRGEWFEWSTSTFVGLCHTITSDVAGTMFVDLSIEDSPTNEDESSVTDSFQVPFNPSTETQQTRFTPVQQKWVRLRYVNGASAQSSFEVNNIFLSSAVHLVMQNLGSVPTDNNLAGLVRAMGAGKDPNDNFVNIRADGYVDAFTSTTPLTAGSSFDTGIVNCP